MQTKQIVLSLLVVLARARAASADPADPELTQAATSEPTPIEDRHHRLAFDFRSYLIFPAIGLSYTYAPTHRLEVEVTAGFVSTLGLTDEKMVNFSAMPKLLFGSENHSFTAGLGVSGFWSLPRSPDGGSQIAYAMMIDPLGYEMRADSGFSFQAALGCLLIPGLGFPVPEAHIGLGYWF